MAIYSVWRWIVLGVFMLFIDRINGITVVDAVGKSPLKLAIIGAGPSGLVSARYAISYGHDVTVFEQGDELGGNWGYTDRIGKDKYGVNIHTATYKGLRTNLPYQMMEFPGYHHSNINSSFPSQPDMLKYLHAYANHFDVSKVIKLNHLVVRVLSIKNDKWEVIVKDLPNNKFITEEYDAVFVCNGHYFASWTPRIDGASEFKGKVMHSHDFRDADTFRDESVLVIGTGPSGMDIVIQLSNKAKRVTISRKKPEHETREQYKKRINGLPPKTIMKDNIKYFTADGAEFIDGSRDTFDTIIYATGYRYSYPFLSVESGIQVDDNFVHPLYKQIFNIEHPTMAFIGLPMVSNSFYLFDLQAQFALKFISGEKKLPDKDDMLENQKDETIKHWKRGYPKRKTHDLVDDYNEYQTDLSEMAGVKRIPDVFYDIYHDCDEGLLSNPMEYRKFRYFIIDDRTFVKKKYIN